MIKPSRKAGLSLSLLLLAPLTAVYAENDVSITSGSGLTNVNDVSVGGTGEFETTDDSASIGVDDIAGIWGTTSDTVSLTTTDGGSNLESGDISLDNDLDFNGGISATKTLDLNAAGSIYINAGIADSDGGSSDQLNLNLNAGSGDSYIGSAIAPPAASIGPGLNVNSAGAINIVDNATNDFSYVLNGSSDALTAGSLNNAAALDVNDGAVSAGAFSNDGVVTLDGGTLGASSYSDNGSGSLTQTAGVATVTGATTLGAGSGGLDIQGGQFDTDSLTADSAVTQSGGTLNVTNDFAVNETYTLSAGDLNAGSLTNAGTIDQSGGTASVTGSFSQAATGVLNLSGGVLNADSVSTVAGSELNLSGGSLTATTSIDVGGDLSLSAAGSVTADSADVSGTATQTGGAADISGTLNVAAGGSYDLSSGSLTTGQLTRDAAGSFSWSGGSLTIDDGNLAVESAGALGDTVALASDRSLTTKTLSVGTGVAASGTMSQSVSNTTNVTETLTVNAGGDYTNSSGVLNAGAIDNNGSFTQAGSGITNVTGTLTTGVGGTTAINGGRLTAADADVSGDLNQTIGRLTITGDTTVNDGGTITTEAGVFVTDTLVNDGTVTQNGGNTTVGGALTVGATGTQNLNGGSLSAGSIATDGAIVQDGTSVSTATLDVNAGGSYQLDSSTLGVTTTNVSGTFTQNGGMVSTSGTLNVDGGAYNKTGGQLGNCADIYCNQGYLDINVTNGGSMTTTGLVVADDIVIGDATTAGSYTLNGGELVGDTLSIGTTGTLTQNDGIVDLDPSTVIAVDGTYNMSGGSLYIGDVSGAGSFNFTGGDLSIAQHELLVEAGGLLGDTVSISASSDLYTKSQTVNSGGTIDQTGGNNSMADSLTINNGGAYNMSGGNLTTDNVVQNGTGAFNYTDGGVYLRNADLDVNSTGLLGNNLTVDGGEYFGGQNINVGTALDAGTVTQDGGSVYADLNQTIEDQGSYVLNGGSNTIDGQLITVGSGSYTQNGGNLRVGSISGVGYNYVDGGLRLTDGDMSVFSGGILGDAITINEYDETFGANNMTVGDGGANAGSVTQSAGSNYIDDVLTINGNGTYDLSGGYLEFGSFAGTGQIDFTGGAVRIDNSNFSIGASGPLGDSVTLGEDMGLYAHRGGNSAIGYDVTVDSGAELVLNGGTLWADQVINNGTFNYAAGNLHLHELTVGATGALGSSLNVNSAKSMTVSNLDIDAAASVIVSGGSLSTGSIDNAGSLYMNGGSMSAVGISNTGAGSFNFVSGNLTLSNLTVGSGGALGQFAYIGAGQNLTVDSNLIIQAGSGFEVKDGQTAYANYTSNAGAARIKAGSTLSGVAYSQSAGKTTVDGNLFASVTVNGGVLDGSGVIGGSLTLDGGQVNPGNSPGSLTVDGNFNFLDGVLNLELSDLGYDQLFVDGSYNLVGGEVLFSLGDSVDIDLLIADFNIDDFFRVGLEGSDYGFLEYGNSAATLANLTFTAWDSTSAQLYNLIVDANGSFSVAPVPVPAALWLFGSALGMLGWRRRRVAAS